MTYWYTVEQAETVETLWRLSLGTRQYCALSNNEYFSEYRFLTDKPLEINMNERQLFVPEVSNTNISFIWLLFFSEIKYTIPIWCKLVNKSLNLCGNGLRMVSVHGQLTATGHYYVLCRLPLISLCARWLDGENRLNVMAWEYILSIRKQLSLFNLHIPYLT